MPTPSVRHADVMPTLVAALSAEPELAPHVSRISTKLHAEDPLPVVHLSRVDERSRATVLNRVAVSVAAYGNDDAQAYFVASVARKVLLGLAPHVDGPAGVAISHVEEQIGPQAVDDISTTPPTPRVVFTVELVTRPA